GPLYSIEVNLEEIRVRRNSAIPAGRHHFCHPFPFGSHRISVARRCGALLWLAQREPDPFDLILEDQVWRDLPRPHQSSLLPSKKMLSAHMDIRLQRKAA